MSKELKPCPFCGGEAKIKTEYTSYFTIGCGCIKCNAKTAEYIADIRKQDALDNIERCKNLVIERWNRRVEDER